jgi:hypothetical protein
VIDQAETLMHFILEAVTGQDPALVTFARAQIPTLVQHLDSAVALDLAVHGLPTGPGTVNALVSSLVPGLPSRSSAAVAGVPDPAHAIAVPSFHS